MTDAAQPAPSPAQLKQGSGCVSLLGVGLIVLGMLAIGSPLVSGLAVAISVGVVLLVSGVSMVFRGFAGPQGSRLAPAVAGVLAALCGAIMIAHPIFGLKFLALLVAIYFLVDGVSTTALAFQMRPQRGWGWALFTGVISIMLGIMLLSKWPLSGAWAIGVLVGINVMLHGWALIAVGSLARGAAAAAPD